VDFLKSIADAILNRKKYDPLHDDFKPYKNINIKDGVSMDEFFDKDGNKIIILTKYKNGKVYSTKMYSEKEFNKMMEKNDIDIISKKNTQKI